MCVCMCARIVYMYACRYPCLYKYERAKLTPTEKPCPPVDRALTDKRSKHKMRLRMYAVQLRGFLLQGQRGKRHEKEKMCDVCTCMKRLMKSGMVYTLQVGQGKVRQVMSPFYKCKELNILREAWI